MLALRTNITDSAVAKNLGFAWYLTLGMFVILFLGDLLSGLGIVPQIAPDLALLGVQYGLLVFALAECTLCRIQIRFPGLDLILLLLSVVLLSAIYNGQGAIEMTIFIRSIIGQYVILVAMMNLRFSGEQFKKLNWVIFSFCAIQIPVSFFRMMTSGNNVFLAGGSRSFGTEAATGTLAKSGGSLGTTFPLVVIGFLFAFYLWKEKRTFLLWMVGFVFFSLCTGKRAFPFVLPIFLVTLLSFIGRGRVISPKIITVALVGIIGLMAGLFLHPSLNPTGKVGGKVDLFYALEKVTANETSVTWEGESAGRYTTSEHLVLHALDKSAMTFLLGQGPATMIKSGLIKSTEASRLSEMEIAYGLTGAGWVFAQIGFVGVVVFFLIFIFFFRKVLRIRKNMKDPYWKAICGGMIGFHLVIFFDTIAYSTTCVSGKLLPALYWFLLAQVLLSDKWERVRK